MRRYQYYDVHHHVYTTVVVCGTGPNNGKKYIMCGDFKDALQNLKYYLTQFGNFFLYNFSMQENASGQDIFLVENLHAPYIGSSYQGFTHNKDYRYNVYYRNYLWS